MDRAIVLDQHDGLGDVSRPRPIRAIELFEMGDEVARSLGRTRVHDQAPRNVVERADHRNLFSTWRT